MHKHLIYLGLNFAVLLLGRPGLQQSPAEDGTSL